jgi:hypothetical protein
MSSPRCKATRNEKRNQNDIDDRHRKQHHRVCLGGGSSRKSDTGTEHFTSEKDLAQLAVSWPISRLVDIWNNLGGVIPVEKKFTDRKKATARIWKAIQSLVPAATRPEARTSATPKPRKGNKGEGGGQARLGPRRWQESADLGIAETAGWRHFSRVDGRYRMAGT